MKRLALALALLLASASVGIAGRAHAQDWGSGQKAAKPFPLTGNPVNDIANAVDASASSTATTITNFLNNLADIDGAVKLSTQIPGLQDPVGNACWQQFAPIQALIKAHPLPLSLKIASDIEAARLAMIAMNKVCANPNCGQMFIDATNAANALAGVTVPISLSSICAKVPAIGTAAVTPATTAAPLVGTVTTPAATTTPAAQ